MNVNQILYFCFIILVQRCHLTIQKSRRMLIGDSVIGTDQRIRQLETSVSQLLTDAQSQKTMINKLADQLVQVAAGGCGGVLYIHWGKKSCSQNSTLVYSGFAGGSSSGHAGGSAEPLCLPRDPIMGTRVKPSTYGIVYGAEYETTFFGTVAQNEDIPCAVCINTGVSIKMMIPGRNKCYSGWNELYHGYLAGNVYSAAGSGNFVCMVENPEFVFGGKADAGGRSFYGVISSCGSLRCPPYNESLPVTCVLCTK